MSASLYGVGAGPGDPELITVRALRLLQTAPVVFLPATRAGASYAGSIVDGYLNRGSQQVVELVCPAYRERERIAGRWTELAEEVASILLPDRQGVFVCEGDPSLFSTFLHLKNALEQIRAEIEIRVVPGVSSVSAAAAAAGFPLALWDERLLIAPAAHGNTALADWLAEADSIALLKPGQALPGLISALQQEGTVRAALVSRAGRPDQQIFTDPGAMRNARTGYFTTLLLRRNTA